MYIETASELAQRIRERRTQKDFIRALVNGWVKREYGIPDYYGILDTYFRDTTADGRPHAVLLRQIPSISLEDVAFYLVAQKLGLVPCSFPFVRDGFTTVNHEKMSRVQIPWVHKSKKGNIVLAHETVTCTAPNHLDRMALHRIGTRTGDSLPEYHAGLRRALFPDFAGRDLDISDLDVLYMDAATNKPTTVFVELPDGLVTKRRFGSDYSGAVFVRPPAAWYYPLQFCMFLTGNMVLFETYENPLGGVPEAKQLFEESVEKIVAGTGFTPLVVRIPPLSSPMLAMSRVLRDSPERVRELETLPLPQCFTLEWCMQSCAHAILDLS